MAKDPNQLSKVCPESQFVGREHAVVMGFNRQVENGLSFTINQPALCRTRLCKRPAPGISIFCMLKSVIWRLGYLAQPDKLASDLEFMTPLGVMLSPLGLCPQVLASMRLNEQIRAQRISIGLRNRIFRELPPTYLLPLRSRSKLALDPRVLLFPFGQLRKIERN